MIALREAWKAGLFRRENLIGNILSGVVVACVALPLAMAFAIASGVKPEQGLYTAVTAGLLVSIFGGSRVQIAGPTGAFVVILAQITAKHGVAGLQIATIMAGAILVLFGLTRFGGVVRFIPAPVIVGFTTGIGVVIWVGQWPAFFGLAAVGGEHFHEKLWNTLLVLPHLHAATTELAAASLAVLLLAPRVPGLRRVPAPMIALFGATAVQSFLHLSGVATIGSAFGGIPLGLPSFNPPKMNVAELFSLLESAFTIAILGAIESLLSATVADGMAATKHDSNQELIGQGIANIVAPMFGGFAATGAIARTATNIRNGGNSPLAGVAHAVSLALVLLFLAPFAENVPLCVLAAILFIVAYNMSDLGHFANIVRRAPRADVVILLITFALTVFVNLVVAVNVGVILAMLQFLRRMSASVEVREEHGEHIPPGVLVYSIEGPLFFGAVEQFERAIAQTHTDPRTLVIRLDRVPFMDATGLQTLEEVLRKLKKRGVRVSLCEANERVKMKLRRAGILEIVGEERSFDTFSAALALHEIGTEH